ncbi:hypothetical protein [Pseudomonas sp. TMP25]|uniref:hypothetical protein n=1 Tax=Pseudomonas sp. TMP25 TaxID=3136561 RepID=UPI003100CDC5
MGKHYAIDREDLEELAEMSRAMWAHIQAEPDTKRANRLREIFDMFGEIMGDVERTPITIKEECLH